MKIAFFSPLPPARSGIADYSAALLPQLEKHATLETFATRPEHFDPSMFDALVYQLGNNPHHGFVYEMAMEYPGVVVLHEANLHHLIADLTIRRGDWKAYWKEVEYNGGIRTEHPDYRLPLLRRILDRSRGVIVHSGVVEHVVRSAGFRKPMARIPHGASVIDGQRSGYRKQLGIDDDAPLFGIFGFLKPYKRIRESIRAFQRAVQIHPRARLLLVGELHPELALDLPPQARHIDYATAEDFTGFISACDAILNLRYPTVGESSGTLMHALGLGKAVVVSDLGSFSEYPDDICLKVPVNEREQDYLTEYMCLIAGSPQVAAALGIRARNWVRKNASWQIAAEKYHHFLTNYSKTWLPESVPYVEQHRTRLERILALTPPGGPTDAVLEMGSYLHLSGALKAERGYGDVRGTFLGKAGKTESHTIVLPDGSRFNCPISHFDAEKDFFPYASAHFSTILCCELLEHLSHDPMHMFEQIHRVLRPGGILLLTTPNLVSSRSLAASLQGYHPMFFPSYIKASSDPRHSREYTPNEVRLLLENCGLEVTHLETGPFLDAPEPQFVWVEQLLEKYGLPKLDRGDCIYALARKAGPVRERYPAWLYS